MQLVLDDLPPTRRYLIGVSGGRDSVALLHELHRRGYHKLVVCHVNHRLRGRASTQDQLFVQRLAKRLGYPCEVHSEEVAVRARAAKQSIETCAREVRHEFFAAVARKHRCPRVLLAHQADDQAETVLMRVLRGTGLSGLAGMRSSSTLRVGKQELILLRPLLLVRRTDIDAYVAEYRLTFREDASNLDTRHTRNQVRQSLLPQINAAIGRDATPMLLRLAVCAERDDALLQQLTRRLWEDHELMPADGSLLLKPELKNAHPALQHRIVHHWLKLQAVADIDQETIAAVTGLLSQHEPARINLPQDLQVRRKSGRLSIASQQPSRPSSLP